LVFLPTPTHPIEVRPPSISSLGKRENTSATIEVGKQCFRGETYEGGRVGRKAKIKK
jgi:hypothetical protein